jgi:hypothetical protein
LGIVLNFTPSTAFSGCPLELDNQASIANTVKTASYVFQGTVKEITSPQLVIQVSQYFKGNGPSTVTVTEWDENCKNSMTPGQEAIFFIKSDTSQSAPSIITSQELTLIQPVSPEIITKTTTYVDCMAVYHPEQSKVHIPCLALDHGIEGIYSADLLLESSEPLLFSVDSIEPQKPFTTQQQAYIDQIDIQVLESLPIQVQVLVKGQLSNPCQAIDQIQVVRQDNTFNITITTVTNSPSPDIDCPDMLVPFEKVIPLEVTGLKAGIYTVNVNNISDTFELTGDNIPFKANIKQIDIQILESFPIQVQVLVKGELSNPCQAIDQIQVVRQDNTFNITITTVTNSPSPDIDCPDMLVPFEEVIPLEVTGLKAGIYTVNVNNISDTFELTRDNIPFKALIQKVDTQVLESFPVQVNVNIKGYLSNGCQQIDQINITPTNNVFIVTVTTTPPPPPEIDCTMALIPFEKTIALDVNGLKAGVYTVDVNGIRNQFELPATL